MRILVFEYITGGGLLNEALPDALAAEGDQMLRALAMDLAAIKSTEVLVIRDKRMPALNIDVKEVRLNANDSFDEVWSRLLSDVDAVWPVAPETGGTLERICDEVLKAGKILLNTPPASVHLAASKQRTLACLAARGIPVVPTYLDLEFVPDVEGPWVVKPDDGVGCVDLCLYDSLGQARPVARGNILQPFLHGQDLSLSLVCDRGSATLLSVNRQRIRCINDRLVLDGCEASTNQHVMEEFAQLATDIARAMPGLWGYVGVDLLKCKEGVKVLEINPRLTTSYAALSGKTAFNPAQLVLTLAQAQKNNRIRPHLNRLHPTLNEMGKSCGI